MRSRLGHGVDTGGPTDRRSVAERAESAGPGPFRALTRWSVGETDARRRLRIEDFAPGDYFLHVSGIVLASQLFPFTIRAGQTTPLEVVPVKGVSCVFVLPPVSEPAPIRLRFSWSRNGDVFECYDNNFEGSFPLRWSRRLLPGRYEVVVTSETGVIRTTRFVLAENQRDAREITLDLP